MSDSIKRSSRWPVVWLSALVWLILIGRQPPILLAAGALPPSGTVVQVFDGDTVLLRSGQRVRYLGIDTPEVDHEPGGRNTQCYGTEAWEANRRWVLHQTVRLQYDSVTRDRYGRLLAYVTLADGRCVNEELIRSGYAVLFRTGKGLDRLDEFLKTQRDAMRNRRGIWGHCPVKGETHYLGNRKSYVFHRPNCEFGRRTGKSNRIEFSSRLQAFDAGFHPCRRCLP